MYRVTSASVSTSKRDRVVVLILDAGVGRMAMRRSISGKKFSSLRVYELFMLYIGH